MLLTSLDEGEVRDDRRVEVGGGAVWGQVASALRAHRLALSSGDTSTGGVGGLTLTVGWLVRWHGLTLTTAVRGSPDQHDAVHLADRVLAAFLAHRPPSLRAGPCRPCHGPIKHITVKAVM
ncbi:FAD-dependent oxidoreductase [Streptosporangium sp. KLBMP 9127]|nr:FAD-dependent oxidoreductase [Streptosporangium sp. KLBMP 9127]